MASVGQLVLGLLVPALIVGCLGGHIAGCEAGSFLDRGSGKTLGESVVVTGPSRDRAREQNSALPPPPIRRNDASRKVSFRLGVAGGLDHLGQRPGDPLLANRADPDTHHIPVDGVREPYLDPASRPSGW